MTRPIPFLFFLHLSLSHIFSFFFAIGVLTYLEWWTQHYPPFLRILLASLRVPCLLNISNRCFIIILCLWSGKYSSIPFCTCLLASLDIAGRLLLPNNTVWIEASLDRFCGAKSRLFLLVFRCQCNSLQYFNVFCVCPILIRLLFLAFVINNSILFFEGDERRTVMKNVTSILLL